MIQKRFLLITTLAPLFLNPSTAATPTSNTPMLRLNTEMHTAMIKRIDVDADERYLVTGSDDKTVRVWSLPEGRLLRVLRPPIGEGYEGRIYAVAISPDGETVAAGGWTGYEWDRNNSIYLFNRATGELRQRLSGHPNVIYHLAYSPDGRYLVASLGGKNGIRVYRTTDYRLQAKDTDYGNRSSYWAEFDAQGRLVTGSYDGYIRLYDNRFNLLKKNKVPGGIRPFAVRFSPSGDKIAVGFDDSTQVNVLSGQNLQLLYSPDTQGVDHGSLFSVAWSQDGRWLYAGGLYWDGSSQSSPILRWSQAGRGSYRAWSASPDTIMGIRALRDGEIVFGAADPAFGLFDANGQKTRYREAGIAYFRNDEGFLLSREGSTVQFGYKQWGKRPARFSLNERTLTLNPATQSNLSAPSTQAPGLNITDWKVNYHPKLNGKPISLKQYEWSRSLAIAPDNQHFLLGADWFLRYFDKQGNQQWEVPVPGVAWGVNIAGNGQVAVAAFADGTLRWYRLHDGQELLAFFPHKDGKRWIVWTPQGYYDASVGAEELIGWHVNNGPDKAADFFDVGQFREIYYRPDVVSKVLETLDPEEALRLANQEKGIRQSQTTIAQALPPVIELLPPKDPYFSTSALKFRYQVRRPSGEPIRSVKVLLNGRPYPAENISRLKQKNFQAGKIYTFTLYELPPEDIKVSLIAENRYATSQPATLSLKWQIVAERGRSNKKNLKKLTPTSRQHNLYVLAIGVSQYDDNSVNDLTYPKTDARDFKQLIEKQKGKGLYNQIKVKFYPDATQDEILDGLDWLENAGMTPDDTAILFLAGHGFNYKGEYYFLPKDGRSKKLHRTGLSYYELKRTMSILPGKVLFFIDSCHAGGVTGGALQMVDMNSISNDLGSDSKGVVVFAASTGKQTSMEARRWKNGAFTEALLEGLNGSATPREGQIFPLNLGAYLSGRVPELVKEVKPSHQQTPTYFSPQAIGDFPIFCTKRYCSR